ncbi:MAG: hypothetical protein DMG32_07635 [Acidobacteria bacterium]|nr:MAG: hypothetical protein DMG32_07635 [Acidobacteriota bacterium]
MWTQRERTGDSQSRVYWATASGRWRPLNERAVAVVGARFPTSYRPPPPSRNIHHRDSAYFPLSPLADFLVPFFLAIVPPFLLDGSTRIRIRFPVGLA